MTMCREARHSIMQNSCSPLQPYIYLLTHCIPVDSSTIICYNIIILYVASDLGLHCLPMTLLWVFPERMG